MLKEGTLRLITGPNQTGELILEGAPSKANRPKCISIIGFTVYMWYLCWD